MAKILRAQPDNPNKKNCRRRRLRALRYPVALCLSAWFAGLIAIAPYDAIIAAEGPQAALGAKVEQAFKESRELAKTLLPKQADLGESWKAPWQLPDAFTQRAESEQAYWARLANDIGLIGLNEDESRQLVEWSSGMLDEQLAEEGGKPGDGLKFIIMQARAEHLPPAQELLEGSETTARMMRKAKSMADQGQDPGEGGGEKMLLDLLYSPFANLDQQALVQMAVQEASMVQHRMRMSYFNANKWKELIETRMDDEKVKEQGLWFMVVDVEVMLLDPNPMHWPPDIPAEEVEQMQAQTRSLMSEYLSTYHQLERKRSQKEAEEWRQEIDKRIFELEGSIANDPDNAYYSGSADALEMWKGRRDEAPRKAEEDLEEIDQEFNAHKNNVVISLYTKNIGEYCQISRLSGVSPDEIGLEASAFSAWLRNGRAISRVKVGGANVKEDMLTSIMDRMLAKMDAKTAHYGGL